MRTTRREFLEISVSAGTLAALGGPLAFAQQGGAGAQPAAGKAGQDGAGQAGGQAGQPADKTGAGGAGHGGGAGGKTLLILGGTSFLGPAVVEAAKARGHKVTLFNRGKTNPQLFPDLEKLQGDRDPNKGEGLKALEGRKWDAVVDTSGYVPRIVNASASLLAPNVKQYVYISSISAYGGFDKESGDESAPVAKMADESVETMGAQFENYGPLKVLCEQAAEKALPGRVTNIRPGFIVGPEDPTDRFTYWPVRIDRGGDVAVPGTPQDPIQYIDVRDLGEWIVQTIDTNTTGVFNAITPPGRQSWGDVITACKNAAGKTSVNLVWIPAAFVEKQEGIGFPIWVPPVGETKGFHRWSADKAIKAGLKFRPVDVTVKDTLAWWKSEPEDRQKKMKAGLTPEKEAELIKAWQGAKG